MDPQLSLAPIQVRDHSFDTRATLSQLYLRDRDEGYRSRSAISRTDSNNNPHAMYSSSIFSLEADHSAAKEHEPNQTPNKAPIPLRRKCINAGIENKNAAPIAL